MAMSLALLGATGCSRFERDWRAAGKEPAPAGEIRGRWQGTWHSEPTGHTGKLRCLLTPISKEKYEARFHAKYKRVLSFRYTAEFTGSKSNEVFYFSGNADLGKLAGGVYHYEGHVAPTNFFSIYRAKYDRGTFQMQRPK